MAWVRVQQFRTALTCLGTSRRFLGLVSSALLVGGLFGASIHVASRVPQSVTIAAAAGSLFLPAESEPLVRTDGPLAPLGAGYLARVLGSDLEAFLGWPPGGTGSDAGPVSSGPRARSHDRSGPGTTTTTAPGPLIAPLDSPLPQFSELAVVMDADRTTVPPGGLIVYRITVTNVGTEEFRGELRLESHHPFWTSDASTPCGESGVDPNPDAPCVAPAVPVPGPPDDSIHSVQVSYNGPIPVGSSLVREFRVRVHPGAPQNTRIDNHAHLDVPGDGEAAETSNTVVVTVR